MPGIFIIIISSVLFPAALPSFTLLLYGFLRRRVEEWDKVHRTGVLQDDFRKFWRTKADGLNGSGTNFCALGVGEEVEVLEHMSIIWTLSRVLF
jgi:hypothetical protein